MEPPIERMPIACVHCAKAKAKCDKKVPCSRCVGKQIICQSRATKRSSQNGTRRTSASRAQLERNVPSPVVFHTPKVSQSSSRVQEAQSGMLQNHHSQQHRHYMPDFPITPLPVETVYGMSGSELKVRELNTSIGNTPPDLSLPITPSLPDAHQFETFLSMDAISFGMDPEIDFLTIASPMHPKLVQHGHSDAFVDHPGHIFDSLILDHVETIDDKSRFRSSTQSIESTSDFSSMNEEPNHDQDSQQVQYDIYAKPARPTTLQPLDIFENADVLIMTQQSWPFFQCNPLDRNLWPFRTIGIYLDGLIQTFRYQTSWPIWSSVFDGEALSISERCAFSVEPFMDWSREKLAATTRDLLRQALDVHSCEQLLKERQSSSDSNFWSLPMLPPSGVMDYFLRSYVVRFEEYYPSIAGQEMNPNSLMQTPKSRTAALLVLLMLASGAASVQTIEARYFTGGLIEACRICFSDIMGRDVLQARDIPFFRSALLLTILTAWSGDKWHMEMAKGQRGMYLAMLQHAGIFDISYSCIQITDCKTDPSKAWSDWKEHEGRHRLAHSWIVVDQEISLFSDTSPLLSIADLHTPVPDSEDLWHATSAKQWLNHFEQVYRITYRSPQSVRDMYTIFIDDDDSTKQNLSPIQLRLLLHPLQTEVCQLRDSIVCLPDSPGFSAAAKLKSATQARLGDVTKSLHKWYNLSNSVAPNADGVCWVTCANFIMYHLISLNVMTNFKYIEQFARHEIDIHPVQYSVWIRKRCIDQPGKVFVHCGQIFRLLRSMPKSIKPPWWAGAIYRVALIAWATSLATNDTRHDASLARNSGQHIVLDEFTMENGMIARYAQNGEGIPMFTALNGQLISASVPLNVLQHCIEVLEEDSTMRLTVGIKRKLCILIETWSMMGPQDLCYDNV